MLSVVRLFIAAAFAVLLVACGTLPGAGPTTSEVVGQAQSENTGFIAIDLSPRVVDVLKGRPIPSFKSTFGDYRPAPEQRIGVGDGLAVTIWEAGAGGLFSAVVTDRSAPGSRTAAIPEQVVSRDGAITVPYAGRVRVVGLRPADVEQLIVRRLEGKAIQPQALVTITRNGSNTVTVTGEVTNGAVVPLNVRGNRLLDVIALAGGVRSPAHETFVILNRKNRSVKVALSTVIDHPVENIHVHPGDAVNLVRAPLTFTAVGATGQNSVIPFGSVRLTLEEAVARAGGLLDSRADPQGVFLLRYEPVVLVRRMLDDPNALPGMTGSVAVAYKFNMREANTLFQARLFQMIDKDIVYVANAPLAEVLKLFTLINTLVSPANTVRAAL